MNRLAFLLPALAALAACKGDPAPPASASTSPTASAAPAPTASVTSPPSASPFSIVAEAPEPFLLYPLSTTAFLDAAGFLAQLGEGPLRQVPAVMKGLEKGDSGRILGIFPDGAWFTESDRTFKWIRDRWAENPLLRPLEKLLDIAAWSDDRAVAAIAMPNNDMRFFLVGGKGGVVVPSPYPADKPKPAAAPSASASADPGAAPDAAPVPAPSAAPEPEAAPVSEAACKVKMKPEGVSLAGLPTGQVYAAGYECLETGHGAPIVERWEPKKVRGTIDALPAAEGVELSGVLARSPTEVFVFGGGGAPAKPYLARFDGKAWSVETAPFAGKITSLRAADDGSLWAISDGALWKKGPAWTKVELPQDARATEVWARTAADVWVTGTSTSKGGLLLRTGTVDPKSVAKLPERSVMARSVSAYRRWAATDVCDKVYVDMAPLGPSKDASTGGAAEVTHQWGWLQPVFTGELAGLSPLVEDDGFNLSVGVPVPSLDVAAKVAAAYRDKLRKQTPPVYCHEPVSIRQGVKFQ